MKDYYVLVECNEDGSVNDTSGVYPKQRLPIREFAVVAPDFYICKLVPIEKVTVTKPELVRTKI